MQALLLIGGKLTGYEIDVFRDNDEAVVDIDDVDLIEFSDEIDEAVISALQAIGCDTAKAVLELNVSDLVPFSYVFFLSSCFF